MESKSNPWLGLASYTESNRLYGRDTEIASLLDIVVTNPDITVIYGKSGIGKTSILRAGIFPRVRTMGFFPVYIRLDHSEENEVEYTQQVINAVNEEAARSQLSTVDLIEGESEPASLWEFFHRYKYQTLAGDVCLPIVFFDQFEELFTITGGNKLKVERFLHDFSMLLNDIAPEETQQDNTTNTLNISLDDLSIDLDNDASSTYSETRLCRLAVSIREDQLYHLEKISNTIPCLKRNRYLLQGLSQTGAVDVVTMPAQGLVTTGVAQEIISQCKNVDDEFIDPAFLSLIMYKLHEKMEAQGGTAITSALVQASVGNIFSDYYQDSIKGVSDHTIDFLEDKLVSKAGFRLSVPLSDAQAEGMTSTELSQLKNSRLVTVLTRGNHSFVELTHDLLCAEVMKDKAEREKIRLARKNRHRMMLMGALAAIVLSIAGVFAYLLAQNIKGQNDLKRTYSELQDKNQQMEQQNQLLEQQKSDLLNAKERIEQSQDSLQFMLDQLAASQKELLKSNWETNDYATRWIANNAIERINNGEVLDLLPELLSRTPTNVKHPDKPFGSELEYALRMAHGRGSHLTGHKSDVGSVAFSPDGKYILSSSFGENVIRLWDAKTRKETKRLEDTGNAFSAFNIGTGVVFSTFSYDGKYVAAGYSGGIISIWDYKKGEARYTWDNGAEIWHLAFSHNGKWLATASRDSTIKIWDIKSQKKIKTITGHDGEVVSVCFNPTDDRIVSASVDKTAKVWNVKSGNLINSFVTGKDNGNSALYSYDGKYLAMTGDSSITIRDAKTFVTHSIIDKHSGHFSFSADNKQLIIPSGSWRGGNNSIVIWDIENKKEIVNISTYNVIEAALSIDNKTIVAAKRGDKKIIVLKSGETNRELAEYDFSYLDNIAVSSNGQYVAASAKHDSTVAIWDARSGMLLHTIKTQYSGSKVAFTPDNKCLAANYSIDTIGVWSIETGDMVRTWNGYNFAISPDGKRIASGSIVRDINTGESLFSVGYFSSICFSNDNKRIITSNRDEIQIFDALTGEKILTINEGEYLILAFSPDGKQIASASKRMDGVLKLWDANDGHLIAAIKHKPKYGYESLSYSPDGKYIVTAASYNEVFVFRTDNGAKVQKIDGGHYAVFTPDGKHIVTGPNGYEHHLLIHPFVPDIQDIIDNLRKQYKQ